MKPLREVIPIIVMVCVNEEEELQPRLESDKNLNLKEELGKRKHLLFSFWESKSNGGERYF